MASEILDVLGSIDRGEFFPQFQPLVDLRSGALYGFELLARWNHSERGLIPPTEFIPLAERDHWVHLMTRTLLQQAFIPARAMPTVPMLAVNISPLQLRDGALAQELERLLEDTGFPAGNLIVEITESALLDDVANARETAAALKALGCRLALDDFGTGYSSLSSLQALPFDELKIDQRFVGSMIEQRESRKIVAAVVGLGHSLGLTTVAEGVETREQAEMLRRMGCELGQGWFYGRPVGADEIATVAAEIESRRGHDFMREYSSRTSRSSLDALPAQRLSQLQAIYDGAPVGLAYLDRDLRYLNVNRRLANMNGRPMEAHLGRTVEEMIPELYPQIKPYLRRALAGEAITGVEVTWPTEGPNPGKVILLWYEPARDEAGEVMGISVALMDVTAIKQAEAAHKASEEHFRYLLELMPQIPWIIDPEGRALDVSLRWLELTGMTGDQWRGHGWLKALHPEDVAPTRDAMTRAFSTGQLIDMTYRVRRSEQDAWTRLRSRGSPRFAEDGKIVCWYGSVEEIDEEE